MSQIQTLYTEPRDGAIRRIVLDKHSGQFILTRHRSHQPIKPSKIEIIRFARIGETMVLRLRFGGSDGALAPTLSPLLVPIMVMGLLQLCAGPESIELTGQPLADDVQLIVDMDHAPSSSWGFTNIDNRLAFCESGEIEIVALRQRDTITLTESGKRMLDVADTLREGHSHYAAGIFQKVTDDVIRIYRSHEEDFSPFDTVATI